MSDIAKHDAKHEGEEHAGKEGGIDFLVAWDAISVDNFLEGPRKIIDFEVGGCEYVIRRN